MRVAASLLLNNGYCYQSYEWNIFRPLGDLQTAINTLDKYEVDEIVIIRPIKGEDSNKNFNLDIELLRNIQTITPISFGGGIRSSNELNRLSGLPVERVCLSSAFIQENSNLVKNAISLFGKQAIIACLPVSLIDQKIYVYESDKNRMKILDEKMQNFCIRFADEIIIYDMDSEGSYDCFQMEILDKLLIPFNKLVITGGVGKNIIKLVKSKNIASSIIENRVLHSENSIEYFR